MSQKVFYNLPKKVEWCTSCVISNQRPSSYPEFKHKRERKNAHYVNFDENGVCDACKQAEVKLNINWDNGKKSWWNY